MKQLYVNPVHAHNTHPLSQRDGTAAAAKTASFEGPSAGGHSGSSGEGTEQSV